MFFRSGLQKFGLKFLFRLYDKRDSLTFSIILIPYLSCMVPSKAIMSHLDMQFLEVVESLLIQKTFNHHLRLTFQEYFMFSK